MNKSVDVFVVGAGINGCGAAADAALRGLSVMLCDKGDIASETSSKSTKLIHGGLRYLEQFDFSLVRKALNERQKLLEAAPHLVHPLKLLLPYEKHMRASWLIRAGLFLYDNLSLSNKLPKSRTVNRKKNPDYFSPLKKEYEKGFIFYDGATKDARLCIANALQAERFGATILNYTELVHAETRHGLWILTLKDKINNQSINIEAKTIINATGPSINEVNRRLAIPVYKEMALVKGSHIVVPALYEGEQAYFLQNKDHRVLFVIPYYGFTMIGTTDIAYHGSLDKIEISEEETNYLCEMVNQYFSRQISAKDVVNSWSGVRPLIDEGENKLHEISRDYSIELCDYPAPSVSIYGGKITTYRILAEQAVNLLSCTFKDLPPSTTAKQKLPGADFYEKSVKDYQQKLQEKYNFIHEDLLHYYVENYGSNTEKLLKSLKNESDLGIHFGNQLYQIEVDYLIINEWAKTCDDILWRRSKQGLRLNQEQCSKLADYLQSLDGLRQSAL